MDELKARWNEASDMMKLVIVVVVIITSPFWFVPAVLVFVVLLAGALMELAINGYPE